jgi:hypothetical protein
MVFSYSFQPATRKDGKSVGIFLGYEVKEGKSPATDRKTKEPLLDEQGEPVMRDWRFVSLLFEFKPTVRGQAPKTIKLTTNGREDLLKALTLMGWVNETMKVILDEEGQGIVTLVGAEEDEDGLEIVSEDYEEVMQRSFDAFVETTKGQKFEALLTKDAKGFWRVEPDSIAPKG